MCFLITMRAALIRVIERNRANKIYVEWVWGRQEGEEIRSLCGYWLLHSWCLYMVAVIHFSVLEKQGTNGAILLARDPRVTEPVRLKAWVVWGNEDMCCGICRLFSNTEFALPTVFYFNSFVNWKKPCSCRREVFPFCFWFRDYVLL